MKERNYMNKLINILCECESIISSTENIEEFVNEEYLDNQEFFIIRDRAEKIQEIITKYNIDNNESLLSDDIEEVEELRIEIYQAAKYIADAYIEDKNDDYDNLDDNEKEVINQFKYISYSASIISDLLNKETV
jgi:hypothetical protein